MTKVLFVQDNDKGGASRALEGLVLNLRGMGITPVVIMQRYNPFYERNGIENYAISFRNILTGRTRYLEEKMIYAREFFFNSCAMRLLERQLNIREFDLIYSNESRFRFGAQIAEKYEKPHIWHIREFGERGFLVHPPIRGYYRDYMAGHADVFIMISNAVSDYWEKKGIPADKRIIIYDGVDVDNIDRNKHVGEKKGLRVIFNASASKMKGQSDYLKALSLLSQDVRDCIYSDFYGNFNINPRYIDGLKDEAERLHIKNVAFNGYCDDILKRLKDYDVGMMCSNSEGFGLVTTEYMAAGLCVIASNAGANPEIITDRENGLLFETGNAMNLSEKIQFAYHNRKEIKEIGARAYKDCNERFTAVGNAEKIFKLIKNLTCENKNGKQKL